MHILMVDLICDPGPRLRCLHGQPNLDVHRDALPFFSPTELAETATIYVRCVHFCYVPYCPRRDILEIVATSVFTIDYIVRLCTAPVWWRWMLRTPYSSVYCGMLIHCQCR